MIKDEKIIKCNCRQRKASLAPSMQEKEDDRCQKIGGDKFVNEKLKHVQINYSKNPNIMNKSCEIADAIMFKVLEICKKSWENTMKLHNY